MRELPSIGVANGLFKMLSLGKFKPSLGISDFENMDLEISPMGRSILYPQAYPQREIKKFTPGKMSNISKIISV